MLARCHACRSLIRTSRGALFHNRVQKCKGTGTCWQNAWFSGVCKSHLIKCLCSCCDATIARIAEQTCSTMRKAAKWAHNMTLGFSVLAQLRCGWSSVYSHLQRICGYHCRCSSPPASNGDRIASAKVSSTSSVPLPRQHARLMQGQDEVAGRRKVRTHHTRVADVAVAGSGRPPDVAGPAIFGP